MKTALDPTDWTYYKPSLQNQRLGPANRDSERGVLIPESFRRRDSLMRPRVNPIAYVALATALLILAGIGKWMVG